VSVQNLGRTERKGKLVFVLNSGGANWVRPVSLTLGPGETKFPSVERFTPPTEGVYELRLAVGGPSAGVTHPWFEYFAEREDAFLESWAGGVASEAIASFRVYDAQTHAEVTQRERLDRDRWLVVAIFSAAAAVAAILLLLRQLGWVP
jgi:hypothetical protein